MLFLQVVISATMSGPLVQVARAAPTLSGALALAIVGLGLAIWTVGLRPSEGRPWWFGTYGVLLTAFVLVVGIASAWG